LQYEWDEFKRQANIAKHGVDFASVEALDWDTASVAVFTSLSTRLVKGGDESSA
jgi:uncharacterized DUF497 family protein